VEVRFARGANNPSFTVRLQRMGHTADAVIADLAAIFVVLAP
jgi:hypothetical protein